MPSHTARRLLPRLPSVLLLLAAAPALGAAPSHVDGLGTYSDSGVDFPSYDNLPKHLKFLDEIFRAMAFHALGLDLAG